MLSQIRAAIFMTLILTVLTGLIYPLAVTGAAQALFLRQSQGSLMTRNGVVVGSELIGQNFTKPEYFHPRPSAAGSNGYDAANSSGSNLGPTNPDLGKRLTKDAAAYRAENHLGGEIPADAITTSASGLDPHITPANALLQVERVASARGAATEQIRGLVEGAIEPRQLGFFGEPRVNVLKLNMELDRRFPAQRTTAQR